jgi:hypothetical protein
MRSQWTTHKGQQIFIQDFSGHNLMFSEAVKDELVAVQSVVTQQPLHSVLVLADFRETQIGKDLMDLMVASSNVTQAYVKKTAVLGVTGTKRMLADILVHITGQPLSFFDDLETAKDWLVESK